MSLEESMLKLAESNIALAEAQNALAEKYERILNGEAAIDPAVVASGAAKTEDAPAARGCGRPKKIETPKVVEDDGLGGEEEEEEEETASRTSDDVKGILQKFKAAGGAPKDIMSKFGAKAFPEIKEADFDAVYEATEKALKKLG